MVNEKTGKQILDAIGTAMMVVIFVVIAALIIQTITTSAIFTDLTTTGAVTNETGAFLNSSGYTLGEAGVSGFTSPVITGLVNSTDNVTIALANVSVTNAGVITNATAKIWANVSVSYAYTLSTNTNLAGLNTTAIGESFGDFVTNLIAFLAIIGTILGVVWLVFYVKSLFDKKTGIQAMTA